MCPAALFLGYGLYEITAAFEFSDTQTPITNLIDDINYALVFYKKQKTGYPVSNLFHKKRCRLCRFYNEQSHFLQIFALVSSPNKQ